VAASPQDAEAAALLARVRLEYGEFDAALSLAETATKLDPANGGYHAILAEAVGRVAQHASVFKQIGMAKRFRQEAEAAIRLDSKNVDAREGLMEYYLNAPSIVGGDRKKADAMAEEIAKVDPATGFLARATILVETKSTGDLESLYQQAIAAATTAETKYRATDELMNFYLASKTRKFDAAEQQAHALLALDPKRAGGYGGLVVAYVLGGRVGDIDGVLAEAERMVPDNLAPYYQAGRALFMQNTDLARAERYLRKYLTVEPEAGQATWAHAHWRLGLVLEKMGRRSDAIAEVEQAVRMKPDLEEAKKDLRRLRS
jgi:tetratricopeptide (TPR) repeat protein